MDIGHQEPLEDTPLGRVRQAAARCWAMLLARIYECLPLTCEKCGQPMRLIAFIMEPVVAEKILSHIGEPTELPAVLPARAPPQVEIGYRRRRDCEAIHFDQAVQANEWPDMDQTAGPADETWN
jgi:hypothetical protein